jgi:hypothetical protein
MDWQLLINIGAGTLLAWVGYMYRDAKSEIRENGKSLHALALKVAQDYVTHAALTDIRQTLRRIEDKLDDKADK